VNVQMLDSPPAGRDPTHRLTSSLFAVRSISRVPRAPRDAPKNLRKQALCQLACLVSRRLASSTKLRVTSAPALPVARFADSEMVGPLPT
jgi:hypothetical protein